MPKPPLAVFILAAGKGTRTRIDLPKVLLPLCGRPLLGYVLDTAARLGPAHTVVVLSHGMDRIQSELAAQLEHCLVVDQGKPLGTGHAVRTALDALDESLGSPFSGDILVLYGDCPLIGELSLEALRDSLEEDLEGEFEFVIEPDPGGNGTGTNGRHGSESRGSEPAMASLLTCLDPVTPGLGRILRDDDGYFVGVREEKDCTLAELEIDEVNTGFCCFRSEALRATLPKLRDDNKQAEYYLTDVFGLLVDDDQLVRPVMTPDPEETVGVNSLADLADARNAMQDRILLRHLENGVMIEDPATTVIEGDVEIGRGTKIFPYCVIRNGVKIGEDCEVGPFAHLRVGAVLADKAQVGNFVEMKNAALGPGSKAKHLTYLGDAEIGEGTNIGAGTVTANYDGKAKHKTVIGNRAFIGSGTIIVAPASVGDEAMTGAGALLTRETAVADGEVYVGVPAKPIRRRAAESSGSDKQDEA